MSNLSRKSQHVILCLLGLVLLLNGCLSAPGEDTSPPEDTSTSHGTAWQVPADYQFYADESDLFRIAYPQDWEVNPEPTGVQMISAKDLKERLESGKPFTEVGYLLFWGVRSGTGYHPSCNIFVEPLYKGYESLSEVGDELVVTVENIFRDFNEISRELVVIGDREAILIEYEAIINGIEAHSLISVTIVDQTIWTNGCLVNTALEDYSNYEIAFQNIIRSLEVHE